MVSEPWLYYGWTMVVEPWYSHVVESQLNDEGSKFGSFAMVQPCMNYGRTSEPGFTMVVPWFYHRMTTMVERCYHGRCYRRIMVNFDESPEVDKWSVKVDLE